MNVICLGHHMHPVDTYQRYKALDYTAAQENHAVRYCQSKSCEYVYGVVVVESFMMTNGSFLWSTKFCRSNSIFHSYGQEYYTVAYFLTWSPMTCFSPSSDQHNTEIDMQFRAVQIMMRLYTRCTAVSLRNVSQQTLS